MNYQKADGMSYAPQGILFGQKCSRDPGSMRVRGLTPFFPTPLSVLYFPFSFPASTDFRSRLSGSVIEVGKDVRSTKPGDRVSIMPLIYCGYSYYCRRGLFAGRS
jgi:Alcohol dehydrogenase GroES-like domain